MKYLKKIIAATVLAISLTLILTGCSDQIQLKTSLNINNDFSGSRVILLEITKSSFESNSEKGIGEVVSLINSCCPPEMISEFKDGADSYQYTFTINFKDQDEYIQKVRSILGQEAEVKIFAPNNIFSSGLIVDENFSSQQLLSWLIKILQENNVVSRSDIFSDNGSTLSFGDKAYSVENPQISVSDLTYTNVSGIDIYTDLATSSTISRTVKIKIPKEEWLSKKDAIQEYTSTNVPEGCTYNVDESGDETQIIFSLDAVDFKTLKEKMKVILDTDAYTIENKINTDEANHDADSQGIDADNNYEKPFSIKTGFTEYLDLSSYAGSASGEVTLNYYLNELGKTAQKVRYIANGKFTDAILSDSSGTDYLSAMIREYTATHIEVSSETNYTANQIDLITTLGNGSKINKEVVLTISPQLDDADWQIILERLKAGSEDNAVIECAKNADSQSVITITISGDAKTVTQTAANLFGSSNTIEYFQEKGFLKLVKTGIFNESIDLTNFITNNESIINYEAKTSFAETIKRTDQSNDNALEIHKRSYKASPSEGIFNVTFTTSSLNYILLILLLAAIIAIITVLVFLLRNKAFSISSVTSIKSKVKEFENSTLAKRILDMTKLGIRGTKDSLGKIESIIAKGPAVPFTNETVKKLPFVLKFLVILAEICFFLPICAVSCGSQSISLNGIKLSFGVDVLEHHVDGNLICLLLMILPIIMAALLFIKKLQKMRFNEIATGLMSVINLIILLVLHHKVIKIAEENLLEVQFKLGYYLAFLSYVLLLFGSSILFWIKSKHQTPDNTVEVATAGSETGRELKSGADAETFRE